MTDLSGADARHAEAMDRMYRFTRHVYDLTRKPYLLGRDRMIAALAVPEGGSVLEMGCGTGRNLIAVARRHPTARLYGFDISAEMLRTAKANIARAGLSHRIQIARGDATAFDAAEVFGLTSFDRVYFSYTLSMIPDWVAALCEGHRLTASGGRLGIVDFGEGRGLPAPFRAGLWRWLALFHVEPRLDLGAALQVLAGETGRPLSFEQPYRGYAQIGIVGS